MNSLFYLIILTIIVFIYTVLLAIMVYKRAEREEKIIREMLLKCEAINNIISSIENEENHNNKYVLVGMVFNKYKEMIKLSYIYREKIRHNLQKLIKDDLYNFYKTYYAEYVRRYNNPERFEDISRFLSN